MQVEVIATEEMGDRSYVAHDGQVAVVMDPQRDLDRVQAVLATHGLRVGLVCETHRHNDYVTGGYALAQQTGAAYVVPAGEDVVCERRTVGDGDELTAGALTVTVVATPGHTDGHVAYVIGDGSGPPAVFTGGSLLYGSVGRTDLVEASRIEELTRAQYRSARRLAAMLPDDAAVYPTHGFGSFCSSGSASAGDTSTIGKEKAANDALNTADEDAFVDKLIAGLTAYPAYYAHMGPLNREGPAAPDLSPVTPVDAEELRSRLAGGQWVVDLRSRTAYAADHAAGTVGIELATNFATYFGWVLPRGEAVTLLGESTQQIRDAQRQLARIGVDELAGASTVPAQTLADGQPLRGYRRVDFADVAREQPDPPQILDVRRDDERAHGAIPDSTHIPIHALLDRFAELPDGQLWVHCGSGYRASIAASLLDRAGRDVVLIDDDYTHAVDLDVATG